MASSSPDPLRTTTSSSLTLATAFVFFVLSGGFLAPRGARAQQPYGGSWIADCDNQHNDSGLLGYFCGGAPSCQTYLTFNARAPYADLASIASLLGADVAVLAAANSVGENAAVPPDRKVLVPATCACSATPQGRFYQRNASPYVARSGDSLIKIANTVFQGLTTCQALEVQSLRAGQAANELQAGQALPVPLRCACPTRAQAAKGARFLVSYLVGASDDVSAVAARFGVDQADVVAANELTTPFTVFPDTTLLIPVTAPPNVSQIQSSPAPPPPPPLAPVSPPPSKKSRAGVYVGVGAAAAAVIAGAGIFVVLKARKRRRQRAAGAVLPTTGAPAKNKQGNDKGTDKSSSLGFTTTSGGEVSTSFSDAFSSISVADIKSSLKVYTYAELRAATDDFSPARRIGESSVYRADFSGDAAAVEAVDRDVAAEVEIMRKINHLNLIRLVGLCHHRGRWYLVTEHAEHGALRDRLSHLSGDEPPLSWAQRVRVALDAAEGLRYLHEYADPPCVHMDVTSGSVLLAGSGPRAKLRGFAAARAVTGRSGAAGGDLVFTMTSRIAGTRGYVAPEYLEHGIVSPKADVYALGVVMLELVTGKDVEELVGDGVGDPFAGLRDLALAEEHGDVLRRRVEELVDPALLAGSWPEDGVLVMVKLIERCVRREPAGRPTAAEVAQRLLKMSGVSAIGWQSSPDPDSPTSPGR